MIRRLSKWLRWRWLDFEDAVTDALDWYPPRSEPTIKPLPPAPPPEQHKYIPFHFTSVGFQRATAESVDAQWTREIMAKLASGRFFEIM